MNSDSSGIHSFRYERKFSIPGMTLSEIEAFIKLFPGMFCEVYYPRFINNLYLDTLTFQSYFDNIDGLKNRVKVRIRWYGNLFGHIEKPVLEFKIKNGLLGRKLSYSLEPFSFDDTFHYDMVRKVFDTPNLPETVRWQLNNLEPSLVNRYRRKYFQSKDKKVRITVDTGLSYFQIKKHHNSFLNNIEDNSETIVELKYDAKENDYVRMLLKGLPFRITRISKYVAGKDQIIFV